MEITARWIHANKTENGGWTRAQLAAIGVSWPPLKGWMGRVIGQEITDSQRQDFELDSARVRAGMRRSLK